MKANLSQLPHFPAFTWSQDVLNPILMSLRLKQGKLLGRMETLQPEFKEQIQEEMIKLDAFGHFRIEDHLDLTGNETNNELARFLVWFNKPGLDRLLKAGIAHLWSLSISPFGEDSGIIARIITNIQLAKADGTPLRYYSMSDQIAKEKSEYEFIVQQALQGSLDITIWLQWFLSCLERAYDSSEIISAPIIERAHFWNTQKHNTFNKRQQAILNKLLAGFNEKLTTTVYAKLTNCARDTALRDITDLLLKGILIKQGGLGKNTEYRLK